MTDHRKLRFCVLRYAPNAVQGEHVNIGVMLFDDLGDGSFADVRFVHNWDRVLCLDGEADLDLLNALHRELKTQLPMVADRPTLMKILSNFSNQIDISEFKGCEGQEPADELESLAKTYLDHPHVQPKRSPTGRTRLYTAMRSAFEQAGVWSLMRKEIRAENYTWRGDPLILDCAYEHERTVKFFHSVSLARGVQQATALAFSYPAMVAGIATKEQLQCQMTTVVESDLDASRPDISFALARLEDTGIIVAFENQLAAIADRARVELLA